MKMYYNKKDNSIVIIGTPDELPTVTYVVDGGKNSYGDRFKLHWTHYNDGYYSYYKDIKELKSCNVFKDEDKVTFCKTVKKKVKV